MQYLAATLPLDRRMPGGMRDRWGAAPLGLLLFLLLVAGGIVATVLIVRSTRTRPAGATTLTPTMPPRAPMMPMAPVATAMPATDTALAHLRIRYARGEVDRDTFLRTAADLGAPVMDTEPPRPAGPPPVPEA